jgi:hypothetical protein
MSDAGPQGHFYGDVWSKYEEPAKDTQGHQVESTDYWDEDDKFIYWKGYCPIEGKNVVIKEVKRPKEEAALQAAEFYQLTPEEFEAISDDAWSNQCEKCYGILQKVNIDDKGNYFAYPSETDSQHMQELFGYEAKPASKRTGYLDPEDPSWQQSVEHIQTRQQQPERGTFGPQSGMQRGEPTRHEWGVTSYLDDIGVPYVHKMTLGELDPTEERADLEYDIFLPDYLIAIESSPGWHKGGKTAQNFPQVTENDEYKERWAKEHGIELLTFDPDVGGSEHFINETLAPLLRTQGVKAKDVPEGKEESVTEIEVFGPISITRSATGMQAKCSEDGETTSATDYDEIAKWVINHLAELHPDYMYSPTMNPPKSPEGLDVGYKIQDIKEMREETKGVGYDWDYNVKYREKPILEEDQSQNFPRYPEGGKVNTADQGGEGKDYKAQNRYCLEEPLKKKCGDCGKVTDDLWPCICGTDICEGCEESHLSKHEEEYEKGNPFNQQYIYREEGQELTIVVPTKFNDGRPVPESYFQEFENFLEDEFKGWSKTPMSGGWVSDTGERMRDESVKYSIYGEDFDENLLNAITSVVGTFWEQQSVLYDLSPSEPHFVEPETQTEPEEEEKFVDCGGDCCAWPECDCGDCQNCSKGKQEEQYSNIDCPSCGEQMLRQELGRHLTKEHPDVKQKPRF